MSLEFQIYDWIEDHEKDDDTDSEEMSDNKNEIGTYIIHTFGRMMDGKSVYMRIINFTPHFYIKLPLTWSKVEAKNNVNTMFRYFTSDMNKKVWAKYRPCLLSMDVVERKSAEGFTNEKLFLFARLIFNNLQAMNKFRFVFEESAIYIPSVTLKPTNFKTFEANLLPMLRCFHIKKISGCSWVEVSEYTRINNEIEKESYCDIEIRVDWRKINPIIKTQNAPLRIMSFDIECFSIDGSFPQSRRPSDHITMIGSTYTYLGESTPYRQHIVCLKKTNDLDNIIVESYDDERDLISAWIREIKRSDCDIITGYNIFFFDEAYIFERCSEQLNIMHEINKISKLKNYECRFRDFKLASSALGENRIRMFSTPGRIHIDLMKDVQKNHKLSCYKLDFVASSFIRDMIISMKVENNTVVLKCSGINDIMVGDFIHIEHALDFISDMIGNKYMITHINIDEKLLTITSNDIEILIEFINTPEYITWKEANKEDRKFKLWWCQAKDDIDVKQIFKSFKGSPDDRAIVAKYCIKDCKLVNLLMDKLNIVTNNIEMSNVCFVPMSFLFTRGQTIKLFSLCLKEFRENGYLFPVLKKPDIKLPSFEGAVVFPPEETIEYEALPVNDFASLYPSVDIEINGSPETKIKNDIYDNIPGVKYHNAKFRDHDGTIQYRRFAEKEKKGVIPTILSNLLKERAIVKKQMKTEKNHFTAKILDGKQLALKVTANSLYGALGADTSPVYDRDIAACITSIGRERLELAKNFVENIVPGFFNGLKYAWLEGREETAKILIEMEVKKQDDKLIERLKKCVTKDLLKIIYQPIVRYGDTDSIFTCYRFRESTKRIKDDDSMKLWKEVVKFSEKLLTQFIPFEYREMWESSHQKYYRTELVTELMLPEGPQYIEPPSHYKIVPPVEQRMEQFLLRYMEEGYLSWLWSIQDIFTKKYIDNKVRERMIEAKLFNIGCSLVERMRLVPEELTDELKGSIGNMVKTFIDKKLREYILEPYWDILNGKKITRIHVYKNGVKIIDKRCLVHSIEMGILAGEFIKNRLPFPHDCKYEKTFWPFLILTKKRYVGNKYEEDPDKYKQDYNGIVLKRRDNAPIVKEICGGIINYLINEKDPEKAKQFTIECMRKMFNNMYNIKYFLTSKTLKMKESYADWTKIAHVVLADRIAIRSPGTAPQSGDRIEFAAVVIANMKKTTLQGERIETPEYIKEHNLKLDYEYYMVNQIMNPSLQFLSLVIPNAERIFDEFKIKIENERQGRTNILDYCKSTY